MPSRRPVFNVWLKAWSQKMWKYGRDLQSFCPFFKNFLTAALTCEQARGKCARNGRGDCEGSRTTPFPIPLLNRAHSGYNSMPILFFLPRLNKGTLPLLLITTEASLQLAKKERALAPNLLRFSQTCEFWSSKANWRLRFSLPSIILTDLLGNETLL